MATEAQLAALTAEITYLQGNLTRVETEAAAAYVAAGDLDVAWLVLCGMPRPAWTLLGVVFCIAKASGPMASCSVMLTCLLRSSSIPRARGRSILRTTY